MPRRRAASPASFPSPLDPSNSSPVSISPRTRSPPEHAAVVLAATVPHSPPQDVQETPRRRLRLHVRVIEPASSIDAAPFVFYTAGRHDSGIKSGALSSSPASPLALF